MSRTTTSETGSIHVGGIERSGKTTLSAFLDAHPDIAVPPVGTNMWTYFAYRFGNLDDPGNLRACIDGMMSYDRIRSLTPDVGRIEADFRSGRPTYGRLFSLFLGQYAERRSKRIWGTQAGWLEKHAEDLFHEYPETRVIHLIRDPRDRFAAVKHHWPSGLGGAGAATAKWIRSASLGQRNQRRYAGRYLVVRFEDLVIEPEQTVKEVCQFLGLDFDSSMLSAVKRRGGGRHVADSRPLAQALSSEYIGIFRDRLDYQELAFLQKKTGRLARAYGYEQPALTASRGAKLRFGLRYWPSQDLRMLAWRIREVGYSRAPGLYGPQIDPKYLIEDARGR